MRGEFDMARQLVDKAMTVYADLGATGVILGAAERAGHVEMLAGNYSGAENQLRPAYDFLMEVQQLGFLSTIAGMLAHALYEQGRLAESQECADVSLRVVSQEDVGAQVLSRSAQAKLLAATGEATTARTLAEEAIRLTSGTDYLTMQANAVMDAGEVAHVSGRSQEAALRTNEAISLYEQKGNVASATRASRFLENLGN